MERQLSHAETASIWATQQASSSSFPHKNSHSNVPFGHSGRIKYASPRDLPSYPSAGLPKDHAAASAAATLGWSQHKSVEPWKPDRTASASAAASLGWANQKPIEPWKPADRTASASAAALMAREYKMPPAWEPERTVAGSKAAVLAAGSAQKPQQRQSSPPTIMCSSAATAAFRTNSRTSPPSPPSEDMPTLARIGSMSAAKGAMADARRQRAVSSPQAAESYPDQANAAANALTAATAAHRPSIRGSVDSGATPYTNMDRQMFTSSPQAKADVEEQRRAEVLHASAVAMAKRMYSQQQKIIDSTRLAHARSSSFSKYEGSDSTGASPSEEFTRPMSFNNLQEAAYRLAQERLAKLHEEHQATRELQEYYGATPASARRDTLGTIRGKLTRRRASSDGEMQDDVARSQHIRKQMSLFNTKLTEVDEQKRSQDREALLAAAQRNVKAQLQGMDQKLLDEKGAVPPSKAEGWHSKAHKAAQMRLNTAHGASASSDQVDIGGGKFMDREEVDRIAAKKVQPLLDEINEKADAERERQAAQKLEEEKKKEEADTKKKLKEQEKDEEKLRKSELKEDERARKLEDKATKAEQRRLAKEEKGEEKAMKVEQRRRGKEDKGRDSEAVVDPEAPQQVPSKHAGISFPKLFGKTKERDVNAAPAVATAAVTTAATTPAVTAPVVTAPAATGPEVAAPAATPPAITALAVTTPAVTDSAVTDSEVTGPAVAGPVVTGPVVTGPEVTGPEVTGPEVAAPAATPPAATPPAVNAPVVTAPAATTATATATTPEVSPTSDEEPSSPPSKMKIWLNRLTRPRAKTSSNAAPEENARKRGFIGGAALTKMRHPNASTSSIDNRSTSMHDVAMAGRDYELGPGIQLMDKDHNLDKEINPDGHVVPGNEVSPNEEMSPDAELGEPSTSNARGRQRDPSLARSVSSMSTNDKFVEARSELSLPVGTPRITRDPASGRGSPVRESRFSENLE